MELLLTLITTSLLSYQVSVGQQHNAKYTFSIDSDRSIVVMNTQTAQVYRCTADLVCPQIQPTALDIVQTPY